MTLRDLQMGESAVITTVGGRGALRQHFLDMGMIPGVQVTLVKYAPMGDPMELRLHGYELTLRLAVGVVFVFVVVVLAGAVVVGCLGGVFCGFLICILGGLLFGLLFIFRPHF